MMEIVPVASGLILGWLLTLRRVPWVTRIAMILVLAACATILSGEFQLSWGFLFPDVLEVAVSCAISFFGVKAWQSYAARTH